MWTGKKVAFRYNLHHSYGLATLSSEKFNPIPPFPFHLPTTDLESKVQNAQRSPNPTREANLTAEIADCLLSVRQAEEAAKAGKEITEQFRKTAVNDAAKAETAAKMAKEATDAAVGAQEATLNNLIGLLKTSGHSFEERETSRE